MMIFTEIIIDAASSAVRQAFLNFATLPTYHTSFFQSIHLRNHDDGPAKPGDPLICTVHNIPFPTIVEVNTASVFSWRGYIIWNWMFNGLYSFQFEPLDTDGTKTRFVQWEELGGLLGGALWLFGRRKVVAGFNNFNGDLKRHIEKGQNSGQDVYFAQ
ncbi:hypothetical protein AbraIFM66951_011918 [Aspergillus brasiliensis]|uniref:Uncharacterized protein n=1 Tax=Aspergillus brasiliensis TaxID=319629 RepID=A0A9W6DPZ3_9EURO|nr:hypothetical protein AbraCBS73388_011639 [Aspergillus brasiliensis]GKZ48160.1 hypothetical protein AbraIFM66951_011918 [Aspergillus brasiliensis]